MESACCKMKQDIRSEMRNSVIRTSLKGIYSKNTLLCIITDIIFIVMVIFVLSVWLVLLNESMVEFVDVAPQILSLKESVTSHSEINVDNQELQRLKGVVDRMAWNIYLVVLSAVAVIIFLAGITKGFIWSRITGQRFGLKFIFRFVLVNFIWIGFWFAIFAVILFKVSVPSNIYLILLLVVIVPYLTLLAYSNFNQGKNVFIIFKKIVGCVSKKTLLSYLLVFVVVFLALNMVLISIGTGQLLLVILSLLLFLVASNWSRVYFFSVVRSL